LTRRPLEHENAGKGGIMGGKGRGGERCRKVTPTTVKDEEISTNILGGLYTGYGAKKTQQGNPREDLYSESSSGAGPEMTGTKKDNCRRGEKRLLLGGGGKKVPVCQVGKKKKLIKADTHVSYGVKRKR